MNVCRGPRGELADIARQARDQLERVRMSRWPGLEPAPERQRPAPTAPKPAGPAAAAAPAQPFPSEPSPWDSLDQIAQVIGACAKCPLHATRTRVVPGEGDPKARLMFVGEAPGEDEDRQGRPFVGKAGKLLDQMIAAMGLARNEVFIANTLKCRPPGNRDPLETEVAACLPYLRAQIALIHPEIICALGRHATHALLGRQDPLGKVRGQFLEFQGIPLLPTFHPSYLLRTPADKKLTWSDLKRIMQRLGLPRPNPSAAKENQG